MLTEEWLSAFVPLGVLDEQNNRWFPMGAGALFHTSHLWIVTAKHVIDQIKEGHVAALVTCSTGNTTVVDLTAINQTHNLDWITDENNDLAASLMPVLPQFCIKAVTLENCIPIKEIIPSMQCLTIGYPYYLMEIDLQKSTPLVLSGVIAGKDSQAHLIYISTPHFQGNSGGLAIVLSPSYNSNDVLKLVPLLAGLVLEPLPESGLKFDDVLRLPPLHLGTVRSTDVILNLLRSQVAEQLIDKIKDVT